MNHSAARKSNSQFSYNEPLSRGHSKTKKLSQGISAKSLYNRAFIAYASILFSASLVSFILQSVVAIDLFASTPLLAFTVVLLTFAFEGFKTLSVLFEFLAQSNGNNRFITTSIIKVIRLTLVMLSLWASVYLISGKISSPFLEQVRTKDLSTIQTTLSSKLANISVSNSQQLESLSTRYQNLHQANDDLFGNEIRGMQKAIDVETDNVVKGVFEGKRYKSFKSRKLLSEKKFAQEREKLLRKEDQERSLINDKRATLEEEARTTAKTEDEKIKSSSYTNDTRVLHQGMHNFITSASDVTGLHIPYQSPAWVIALLMAIALEAIILVISSHIAQIIAPRIASYSNYKSNLEKKAAHIASGEMMDDVEELHKGKHRRDHAVTHIYNDLNDAVHSFTE